MTTDQLSATSSSLANTGIQTTALPATPRTDSGINWALVAIVTGSLLIFAALIWQIASRRPAHKIRNPIDDRAEKQLRAKFCRNCGEPIDEGDRFCGGCGSEL